MIYLILGYMVVVIIATLGMNIMQETYVPTKKERRYGPAILMLSLVVVMGALVNVGARTEDIRTEFNNYIDGGTYASR